MLFLILKLIKLMNIVVLKKGGHQDSSRDEDQHEDRNVDGTLPVAARFFKVAK